jgi:hypothetical protein
MCSARHKEHCRCAKHNPNLIRSSYFWVAFIISYTVKLLKTGQQWDQKNMAGLEGWPVLQRLKKLANIQGGPVF